MKKTFSGQVIFLSVMFLVVLILAALLPFQWTSKIDGFTPSSKMVNYASVGGQPVDTLNNHLLSTDASCTRTIGGLHCNGGDNASVGGIDVFYGLSSDMSCGPSNLTKSGGNVCLDPTTTQLLTSRGGNFK